MAPASVRANISPCVVPFWSVSAAVRSPSGDCAARTYAKTQLETLFGQQRSHRRPTRPSRSKRRSSDFHAVRQRECRSADVAARRGRPATRTRHANS
jgi:hypothetical protein